MILHMKRTHTSGSNDDVMMKTLSAQDNTNCDIQKGTKRGNLMQENLPPN